MSEHKSSSKKKKKTILQQIFFGKYKNITILGIVALVIGIGAYFSYISIQQNLTVNTRADEIRKQGTQVDPTTGNERPVTCVGQTSYWCDNPTDRGICESTSGAEYCPGQGKVCVGGICVLPTDGNGGPYYTRQGTQNIGGTHLPITCRDNNTSCVCLNPDDSDTCIGGVDRCEYCPNGCNPGTGDCTDTLPGGGEQTYKALGTQDGKFTTCVGNSSCFCDADNIGDECRGTWLCDPCGNEAVCLTDTDLYQEKVGQCSDQVDLDLGEDITLDADTQYCVDDTLVACNDRNSDGECKPDDDVALQRIDCTVGRGICNSATNSCQYQDFVTVEGTQNYQGATRGVACYEGSSCFCENNTIGGECGALTQCLPCGDSGCTSGRCGFETSENESGDPRQVDKEDISHACASDGSWVTITWPAVTNAQGYTLRLNAKPYDSWVNEEEGDTYIKTTGTSYTYYSGQGFKSDTNYSVSVVDSNIDRSDINPSNAKEFSCPSSSSAQPSQQVTQEPQQPTSSPASDLPIECIYDFTYIDDNNGKCICTDNSEWIEVDGSLCN
jgi:hypothetical protein